jgi:hypothetical protein
MSQFLAQVSVTALLSVVAFAVEIGTIVLFVLRTHLREHKTSGPVGRPPL